MYMIALGPHFKMSELTARITASKVPVINQLMSDFVGIH